MKTKIFLVVMVIFVLTGCSNKELNNVDVVLPSVTIPLPTNTSTSTPTLEPTATPEPTETMTPTITITTSPTPEPTKFGGGVGIFSNITTGNNTTNYQKLGIYKIDLFEKSYFQITGPEYDIIGVSPDFKNILVLKKINSEINELSVIHVSDGEKTLLASNVFGLGSSRLTAYWYENNLIAFIGWEQDRKYIYTIRPDGSELTKLSEENLHPREIHPSSVEAGVCFSYGYYYRDKYGYVLPEPTQWCLPFDGSDPIDLKIVGFIAFSAKPGIYAFSSSPYTDVKIIFTEKTLSVADIIKQPWTDIQMIPISWSPDGHKLIVQIAYPSGGGPYIIEYLVVALDGTSTNIPILHDQSSGPLSWSPDSTQILIDEYLFNTNSLEITQLGEFLPEGWCLYPGIWGDRYRYH